MMQPDAGTVEREAQKLKELHESAVRLWNTFGAYQLTQMARELGANADKVTKVELFRELIRHATYSAHEGRSFTIGIEMIGGTPQELWALMDEDDKREIAHQLSQTILRFLKDNNSSSWAREEVIKAFLNAHTKLGDEVRTEVRVTGTLDALVPK